jgi:adenosylhomocysteine nucleosidase
MPEMNNESSSRPVLIITGLIQEARVAAGSGMVICSGSVPAQLRAILATLDPSRFRAVVSFGIAGGLDPTLRSGDVVVATEVTAGTAGWLADARLNDKLVTSMTFKRGRRTIKGGLAGVERVIVGRACKAALRRESGAAAVDMESHIAAAYAVAAALPFAALRVISDPAHRALPVFIQSAIRPNGEIDLRGVLRGIAHNPLTLRSLVSTGIDFSRALRSLRGCRGFLPCA